MALCRRDYCGLKKKSTKRLFASKLEKLSILGSAHQRIVDAQVGDRELHSTAERNKCTRTAAMTVRVDLGSLRAARSSETLVRQN